MSLGGLPCFLNFRCRRTEITQTIFKIIKIRTASGIKMMRIKLHLVLEVFTEGRPSTIFPGVVAERNACTAKLIFVRLIRV